MSLRHEPCGPGRYSDAGQAHRVKTRANNVVLGNMALAKLLPCLSTVSNVLRESIKESSWCEMDRVVKTVLWGICAQILG